MREKGNVTIIGNGAKQKRKMRRAVILEKAASPEKVREWENRFERGKNQQQEEKCRG